MKPKRQSRAKRRLRIRSKISGTADRPRMALFRSNRHLFAQVINDDKGITVVSVSDGDVSAKKKMSRKEVYFESGMAIAQKAVKKGVSSVVFDRGGFKYHGLVSAFAEGARKGGLKF